MEPLHAHTRFRALVCGLIGSAFAVLIIATPALAAERGELAQPIVPGLPDLLAEVALAARREQARSIGDVLLRRTRLGLLAARDLEPDRAGEAAAPVRRVADVLAGELGWSSERVAAEVERFAQEARAEGSFARDTRADGSASAEGGVARDGGAEGSVAQEARAAEIEPA